nr:hypothetical protein [Rickettsia rhipicephali]
MVNEEELIEKIERFGLKVIYLELSSPYKQAQLFNKQK